MVVSWASKWLLQMPLCKPNALTLPLPLHMSVFCWPGIE